MDADRGSKVVPIYTCGVGIAECARSSRGMVSLQPAARTASVRERVIKIDHSPACGDLLLITVTGILHRLSLRRRELLANLPSALCSI
jgi:hypothetical protein